MTGDEPPAGQGAVDLLAGAGIGPLWGMASTDLNATLLLWPAGHELAEHVNADLDVLLIVIGGAGQALVDGAAHDLVAGSALLIPRGTGRTVRAGNDGLRYLSVHRRREALQIQPLGSAG